MSLPPARRREPCSTTRPARWRAAFLLACAFFVTHCGEAGLTVEQVRERGFIRVGYSEEPPYAFLDSLGRVSGESPEALRSAATALGIADVRWVPMDFRDLIPALQQGRIDVVAAGLFPTAERVVQVRFSRPTACSGPALITFDTTDLPADLAGIQKTSSRVAVLAGSVEEAALRELGFSAARVFAVPDLQTALVSLDRGHAQAVAITAPTARHAIQNSNEKGLRLITYNPPPAVAELLDACSALAFRHQDEALATEIDTALADVLASHERKSLLHSLGFSPTVRAEGARR